MSERQAIVGLRQSVLGGGQTITPGASTARRPLPRFLAVGVVNTLLTLVTIWMLRHLGVGDTLANGIGYLAGLAFSFFGNRMFTFKHRGAVMPVGVRFTVAFAGCWLLNLAVVHAGLHTEVPPMAAHLLGMPVYTLAFYTVCRLWVYRADDPPPSSAEGDATAQWAGMGTLPLADLRNTVWFGLVMVLAAFVFFARLGALPIEVWDEARLAINAQEMVQTGGLSVITTFDGRPDHWNTKPPLAIWAMALSMEVFGINEFAARLPSALSALLTVAMVFSFVLHIGGSLPGAAAAALAMLATPGYIQYHGARAGDFDSMLALWTSALAFATWLGASATTERDRDLWYALALVALIAGFMTKTIQAMLMTPALLVWIGLQRRSAWTLRSKAVWFGVPAVIGMAVGWYLLRDKLDPGYFRAALENDLIGRYGTVIEGHQGSPLKYLLNAKEYPLMLPALVLALIAWRVAETRARSALGLLLAAVVFYLAVISSAQTKLPWYAIPVVPLYAAMVGISVGVLLPRWLPAFGRPVLWGTAFAIFGVGLAAWHVSRVSLRTERLRNDIDGYAFLVRGQVTERADFGAVLIVHPGYNSEGEWYAGPMTFYANRIRAAGRVVAVVPPGQTPALLDRYDAVVACGKVAPHVVASPARWVPVARMDSCAVWRRRLQSGG